MEGLLKTHLVECMAPIVIVNVTTPWLTGRAQTIARAQRCHLPVVRYLPLLPMRIDRVRPKCQIGDHCALVLDEA